MEENEITEKIIGAAIEVHKILGPGLLESIYENALCVEFEQRGVKFERQKPNIVDYKGNKIGDFRVDIVVEDKVVVELKAVNRHDPIFEAQILTYMRISGCKLGLLINFNAKRLKDGVKRFII